MSEKRNVAIIGAGIGAQHASGYMQLPDRFRIHTICDLNTSRAQPIAEKSQSVVESDFNNILANNEIDIIDICLPPHLHFEYVVKALKAEKQVICEKPLATSVAEADKLIEISRQTKKQVFPVFQYRFGIGASQFKALIARNLTGKPYVCTLETHWNRGTDYYDVDWRGTWSGEQGGAVLGHAIHIHDWLSFILGPVSSVYALLDTRVNDIEVEDCAALSIKMENGALVTSSVTLGASDNTSRLRFCFEKLTAESDTLPYNPAEGKWQFSARNPFSQSDIDECIKNIGSPRAWFTGFLESVANALDGDTHTAVSLQDGRQSLEFVTAVYHSARTNRPVELPITDDHELYNGWLP